MSPRILFLGDTYSNEIKILLKLDDFDSVFGGGTLRAAFLYSPVRHCMSYGTQRSMRIWPRVTNIQQPHKPVSKPAGLLHKDWSHSSFCHSRTMKTALANPSDKAPAEDRCWEISNRIQFYLIDQMTFGVSRHLKMSFVVNAGCLVTFSPAEKFMADIYILHITVLLNWRHSDFHIITNPRFRRTRQIQTCFVRWFARCSRQNNYQNEPPKIKEIPKTLSAPRELNWLVSNKI